MLKRILNNTTIKFNKVGINTYHKIISYKYLDFFYADI